MKPFRWKPEKNEWLKLNRKICFEDVAFFIENGNILDDFEHPNQEKYKGQKVFIIEINSYVFMVPYFDNDEFIELKTIIPSRKFTKKYLGGSNV